MSLCLIGTKGTVFFRRLGLPILANVSSLGDRPHVKDLIGTVKVMLDAYREGKIDRLLHRECAVREHDDAAADGAAVAAGAAGRQQRPAGALGLHLRARLEEILDGLLMRYIESQVYRAVVENVASEMAARMVAMKAATDNAGKLIGELQLIYNKARQAAITKELSEIVGGAAAV